MLKLAIVVGAALLTVTAFAAPFSSTIPLPIAGISGSCAASKSSWQWYAFYSSIFGGDWNITGISRFSDGGRLFRDTFSGTVSDKTINGTFTELDFEWTSDGYFECLYFTEWEFATTFTLTINNGSVTGSANFIK